MAQSPGFDRAVPDYMEIPMTAQEMNKYEYTWEPKFKNPWYPHQKDLLSLNQIHLYIIHGWPIDKLPADVRAKYDEALPYLKRAFYRG